MERVYTLREQFDALQIEAFLVTKVENVTYLSGFQGDSSYLFVTPNTCYLITDGRYTEQALMECHPEITVTGWVENIRYGAKTIRQLAEDAKVTHIGFESENMVFADYNRFSQQLPHLQWVPQGQVIDKLRQIKSDTEIANLQRACEISDRALELTLPKLKAGVKEIEVTAELEYQLKVNGADDISFKTIVLTGARTSLLHGQPGQAKIANGDFLLFDFGALYNGYHADISRTFCIGKANQEQKKLYACLQKAQQSAVNMLTEGATGHEADKIVREILSPQGYLEHYYPGMGHGVGLEIHEQPFIKVNADFEFKSGMVVTIEPGVYLPGWGGMRIEDTVLVTKENPVSLTKFPRDLMEL